MRSAPTPPSPAKRRLLEAAEQLFAERGIAAVSVRDITGLAKANVAAINYHFGTREGLLDRVVSSYLTPLTEERLARLDQAERKWSGKVIPLEEVLEAMVRPLLGSARKCELPERSWCKLMGQILAMPDDQLPVVVAGPARVINDRLQRLLTKSLPMVTPDDVQWRSQLVVGALVHLLLNPDLLQPRPGQGGGGMEAMLGRFVRFAAAALREGVTMDLPPPKGPQAMFDF